MSAASLPIGGEGTIRTLQYPLRLLCPLERPPIVCVFGMQKSASNRVREALAEVPSPPFGRALRQPSYMAHPEDSLRTSLRWRAPIGGVLHGHALPTKETLAAARALDARLVVTVRHPADQIAAVACHTRRQVLAARGERRDTTVADSIRSGRLYRWLHWVGEWLRVSRHAAVHVVRYEDLMAKPRETIEAAAEFAFGGRAGRMERALAQLETRRPDWSDPYIYPQGWTGDAGIWRAYFDAADLTAYRRVVAGFLDCHPAAAQVRQLYPGIADPEAGSDADAEPVEASEG